MSSAKRRPRASIACTECRRKKIRCDTGQPKCKNCQNTSSECVYHSIRKPATNGQKRQKMDVSARLARIEWLLEKVLDEQYPSVESDYEEELHPDTQPFDDPVKATEVVATRFHTTPLDDPIYSHGLATVILSKRYMDRIGDLIGNHGLVADVRSAVESFVAHIAQRTIDNSPLLAFGTPSIASSIASSKGPSGLDQSMVDLVNASMLKHPMPSIEVLVSRDEFMALQQNAIVCTGPYCGPGIIFNAVVSTMLAHNIEVKDLMAPDGPSDENRLKIVQTATAYKNAINAVLNASVFRPNLAILKGMLAVLSSPVTYLVPASSEMSLARRAIEICVDLGLNRRSFYNGLSSADQRAQKLCFWMAYCANRSTSLRIGCAPTMALAQISTELPDEEPRDSDLCALRTEVQLFNIYDVIYERICSVHAERKSLRQLIRDIMFCDQKLEEWWTTLEPWMMQVPGMGNFSSDTENAPLPRSRLFRLTSIISSYHYLTICVHRMTALIPSSVYKQLKGMFPSVFQPPSTGIDSADSTPHSDVNGFEDLSPNELRHRVSRLLNSMEICAESARQLLEMYAQQFKHKPAEIVTSGCVHDLLNTTAVLGLKSVHCFDSKCHDDAILLRSSSEAIAQRLTTKNEACELILRVINTTADTIEYMCRKHSQGMDQQPLPGSQAVSTPAKVAANNHPKPQFERRLSEHNGGPANNDVTQQFAWPTFDGESGDFEGLVSELFPEFGLPQSGMLFDGL